MIPHIETSQLTGSYTMETFKVGQKKTGKLNMERKLKLPSFQTNVSIFFSPQNARKPKVLWCLYGVGIK